MSESDSGYCPHRELACHPPQGSLYGGCQRSFLCVMTDPLVRVKGTKNVISVGFGIGVYLSQPHLCIRLSAVLYLKLHYVLSSARCRAIRSSTGGLQLPSKPHWQQWMVLEINRFLSETKIRLPALPLFRIANWG